MYIKNKINLAIIFVLVIPMILVLIFSYYIPYRLLIDHTKEEINNIASFQEQIFRNNINKIFTGINLVASRTQLKLSLSDYLLNQDRKELDRVREILTDARDSVEDYQEIYITDLTGQVIVSTDQNESEFVLPEKIKKEAAKDQYICVSCLRENNILLVGQPLELVNQKVLLIIKKEPEVITANLKNYDGFGKTGETVIANRNDNGDIQYIYTRRHESEINSEIIPKDSFDVPIVQAMSGIEKVFTDLEDYRGVKVFAATRYIEQTDWGLVSKVDRVEILSNLHKFYLYYVLFIIFLLLITALTIIGGMRIIVGPLKKFKEAIKAIERGDTQFSLYIKQKDEFQEIANMFNNLMYKVNNANQLCETELRKQEQNLTSQKKDLEDQQQAILNILEDVEDEKKKSDQLARDLEKFKLAVDNASDHVVITDIDGIILYANKAVEEITGFNIDEIIGQKAGNKDNWGGKMKLSFYKEMWDVIKNKKKPFVGEVENIKKNGQKYIAYASISPVLNNSGEVQFFVGIERDITKEKEIDRAKTEFVSLASHQLRTPLSTIKWYIELLLTDMSEGLNKEQKEFLQQIEVGNQRLIDLVNSLLNVSRLELGTFMIEPEDVDFIKLANSVVDELKPQIVEKSLKLNTDFEKLKKIKMDPKLIRIVLQNILTNAIKYTPDKGKINFNIKKKDKNLLITVKDTGLGIPRGQQDKIFTKLFRADNVRKTDTEGTGLGLYLVKSIVEFCCGKVWFKSVENKGTEFFVQIPLSGMFKREGTKSFEETKLN